MKLRNEMAIMKILNLCKDFTKIKLLCITGGVAAFKPVGPFDPLLLYICFKYVRLFQKNLKNAHMLKLHTQIFFKL